jgi:uncharacterized protein YoxC
MDSDLDNKIHSMAQTLGEIKGIVSGIEKNVSELKADHKELKKKVYSVDEDLKIQKAKIYTAVGFVSFITGILGAKFGNLLELLK